MSHAGLCSLLALALLVGVGACDGGEVIVFSPAQAGSAGVIVSAGAGGFATTAGAEGSLGGALAGASGSAATTSGGSGGIGDTPCQTKDDCGPAWYCQKPDCAAPSGVCLPRPVSDDPVRAPVCGCNITYFNDTLRQQQRVPASTPGECGSGARTCNINDDCGPGGSCSRQLDQISDCNMPGTGQCWVVPDDCSLTSDKPHWLPCPPPGTLPGAPLPPCLTTCQAIQAGYPFLRAPKNTCP